MRAKLLHFRAFNLHRKGRQYGASRLWHKGAATRYHERVIAGLGNVCKQRAHLRRRFEVMVGCETATILLRDDDLVGNAKERVVRLIHVLAAEIDIVGRDQRDVVFIGQIKQRGFKALLAQTDVAAMMTANFHIKAIEKQIAQLQQTFFRFWRLIFEQKPPYGSIDAAG